jgi:hypothetical protein
MPRTAEEVITQAIKENRKLEYLLCAFAVVFVIAGLTLVGVFIASGGAIAGLGGLGLNGLAWPAYRQTSKLRQENLMLRLLEVPLSRAKTSDEAAKMLTEQFASLFRTNKVLEAKQKGATK